METRKRKFNDVKKNKKVSSLSAAAQDNFGNDKRLRNEASPDKKSHNLKRKWNTVAKDVPDKEIENLKRIKLSAMFQLSPILYTPLRVDSELANFLQQNLHCQTVLCWHNQHNKLVIKLDVEIERARMLFNDCVGESNIIDIKACGTRGGIQMTSVLLPATYRQHIFHYFTSAKEDEEVKYLIEPLRGLSL